MVLYRKEKKEKNLLSKLGGWESWVKVEGKKRGRERSGEKSIAQ